MTDTSEVMAEAAIVLSAEAFAAVMEGTAPNGDVLAAARVAGVMAAKKTSELIPFHHAMPLSDIAIDFEPDADRSAIRIVVTAKTTAQTGVEMESLTAASIAALTVYDMVRMIDKGAVIESVRALTKSGGETNAYIAPHKSRVERAAVARPRARVRPSTLTHETAAPPSPDPNADREAFRNFMVSRQLRATDWAKQAGVPASQIYSYLTGRSRGLSPDVAERLAQAARARIEDMFARGR